LRGAGDYQDNLTLATHAPTRRVLRCLYLGDFDMQTATCEPVAAKATGTSLLPLDTLGGTIKAHIAAGDKAKLGPNAANCDCGEGDDWRPRHRISHETLLC
jgi:hypothetical protein